MNTSIDNITSNISNGLTFSSSVLNQAPVISSNNLNHIFAVKSFENLPKNWDSYNANKPSSIAVIKAIDFIIFTSDRKLDVFFSAPTPDGDILIEFKNNTANLELIFSSSTDDKIIASNNNNFSSEAHLNETTFTSYLKWLND